MILIKNIVNSENVIDNDVVNDDCDKIVNMEYYNNDKEDVHNNNENENDDDNNIIIMIMILIKTIKTTITIK